MENEFTWVGASDCVNSTLCVRERDRHRKRFLGHLVSSFLLTKSFGLFPFVKKNANISSLIGFIILFDVCVVQGIDGFAGYNYTQYPYQYPYLGSAAGGAVTSVPSTQTYQLIDSPVTTSAGKVAWCCVHRLKIILCCFVCFLMMIFLSSTNRPSPFTVSLVSLWKII